MKYAWIAKNKVVWPVTMMCEVLGVSTSGYFEHQRRGQTSRPSRPGGGRLSNEAVLAHIRAMIGRFLAGIAELPGLHVYGPGDPRRCAGAVAIFSSTKAGSKCTRSPRTSAPAFYNNSRASGSMNSMPISFSTSSDV